MHRTICTLVVAGTLWTGLALTGCETRGDGDDLNRTDRTGQSEMRRQSGTSNTGSMQGTGSQTGTSAGTGTRSGTGSGTGTTR